VLKNANVCEFAVNVTCAVQQLIVYVQPTRGFARSCSVKRNWWNS